jgi:ubiquinone/menaquinone biosynthesis C-methylase UbiE/broad specificity phosphatase PhoE
LILSDNQSPQPESKTTRNGGIGFRLLLICHAEEMQNRYANLVSSDSGLTALGWQQTDVLAEWLRSHYQIHALISAPELRNRLTAQRVGQSIGLPVSVHQSLSQLMTTAPATDIVEPATQDDTDVSEDPSAAPCLLLQRILDPLIEKHRGKAVAMFAREDVIASVLDCLLGVNGLRLMLMHTSVSELQFRDGQWVLSYLNRREHLPEPVPDDIASPLQVEATPDIPEDLSLLPQIYNQNVAAFVEMDDKTRRKRFDDLISFSEIQSGDRVLDVGTGTGLLALALAESCEATVVGIDISPAMLERAEFFRLNSTSEIARRVDFRLATAQVLPFAKERFDVAICRMVLHLNRQPGRVLRELWRVLRPGGVLVIADLLSTDDPVRRATQNAIEGRRNSSHVAAYSTSQYREMVVDAGFVTDAEKSAVFSRILDDWLAELNAEPANGAVVREMVEASLETDAAGINARRNGDQILFDQRLVYLRAVKRLDQE